MFINSLFLPLGPSLWKKDVEVHVYKVIRLQAAASIHVAEQERRFVESAELEG